MPDSAVPARLRRAADAGARGAGRARRSAAQIPEIPRLRHPAAAWTPGRAGEHGLDGV